jgi:para-nitrobenzyl esterase
MKSRYLISLVGSVLLAGCSTVPPTTPVPPPTGPQITLADGAIGGVTDGDVQYFKAIPYAAPPLGDLRWKAPQPVTPWQGVRDTSHFVHDCVQQPMPMDAARTRASYSEDCLYLNVWRPAGGGTNLPVMVWIHGGGFVSGGTSPAIYDGSHFADKGVVFVSLNYRLGRFGFFGFPALTAENPHGELGNYGYMDQIAALKWVKANIAAFGGNPDNVMVFGESAGGGSVHVLLTSPMAKGLFNKAAIESGGGRGDLMGARSLGRDMPGAPSLETIGVNFAKANGIDGTDADALAKLRALPADKLVAGLSMMSMMMPSAGAPTYGGPVTDGKIVVQSPAAAYTADANAHIPLLIGANGADIGLSMEKSVDNALTAAFGADKAKARSAYLATTDGTDHTIIYSIAMDKMMVEPARFTAKQFARQGTPAYEYRFSYESPIAAASLAASPFASYMIKGAQHASEIPYAFDTIGDAIPGATPDDEAMAKKMNVYWSNFAKTGDPNGADLPQWPVYAIKADRLMNFTQDGPKPMADPWRARLDLVAKHANDAASPH